MDCRHQDYYSQAYCGVKMILHAIINFQLSCLRGEHKPARGRYSLPWPWPWPYDLETGPEHRYFQDESVCRQRSCSVKPFKSYSLNKYENSSHWHGLLCADVPLRNCSLTHSWSKVKVKCHQLPRTSSVQFTVTHLCTKLHQFLISSFWDYADRRIHAHTDAAKHNTCSQQVINVKGEGPDTCYGVSYWEKPRCRVHKCELFFDVIHTTQNVDGNWSSKSFWINLLWRWTSLRCAGI